MTRDPIAPAGPRGPKPANRGAYRHRRVELGVLQGRQGPQGGGELTAAGRLLPRGSDRSTTDSGQYLRDLRRNAPGDVGSRRAAGRLCRAVCVGSGALRFLGNPRAQSLRAPAAGGVSVYEAQAHWITQQIDEFAQTVQPRVWLSIVFPCVLIHTWFLFPISRLQYILTAVDSHAVRC